MYVVTGDSYSIFGLNLVAINEGNEVGSDSGLTLESCKVLCSETPACSSFVYCADHQTCWRKDMVLKGDEGTKETDHCTTYFEQPGKLFSCTDINTILFL